MGPNPVSLESIATYTALTGITLDPWEVELVEAADDAWLRVVTAKHFDWPADAEGSDG